MNLSYFKILISLVGHIHWLIKKYTCEKCWIQIVHG